MQQVTVSRQKLINRLKDNRDKHRVVFLTATEKFRTKAIEVMDARLNEARDGRRIHQYLGLEEPKDHTRDYDRVLDMLAMSVDENITLSAQDFATFARDEWSWKEQFTTSIANYGVSPD